MSTSQRRVRIPDALPGLEGRFVIARGGRLLCGWRVREAIANRPSVLASDGPFISTDFPESVESVSDYSVSLANKAKTYRRNPVE